MRQFCTVAVVLSIASLTIGCQQAPNASSPLTPVGTLSPPQLAPVSATSTGIGPFGAPTRIPPPGTGSYSVPNNYMGGNAAAIGQVGVNPTADSFRSTSSVQAAAFADSPGSGGVAPTSFGGGFAAQTAPQPTQISPVQPQLGGMRVHDLTGAPSPPGYRGASPMMPNQPPPNQVPITTPNPIPNTQQQPFNSAPSIQIPNRIPGADVANRANNNQQVLSIAQRPGASLSREVPIQPSPLQPSFNGASQFQSQTPSTDPVDNSGRNQPQDLPWRRPTAAY